MRKPVLPEPSFDDVDYQPKVGTRLFDKFQKSGLQIIVKIASVELTPDKPTSPQGSWYVEGELDQDLQNNLLTSDLGQMNEHIVGTTLYYLDSNNVTSSKLSFRMQTPSDIHTSDDFKEFHVRQGEYHWLESVFGTRLESRGHCLQNYGSVETKERRLLAFLNVL